MTLEDMIWETKNSLYSELENSVIDEGDKKTEELCYNIAIYSALESIIHGKKFISDKTSKPWDQLKETLAKYKQVKSKSEYDGFGNTDEWKNSLEPKDREILNDFEKLKKDSKTGIWIPANNKDEIYEIIKNKHPKLYGSWYFRDESESNNLEDEIDCICYKIAIANEYKAMNLK